MTTLELENGVMDRPECLAEPECGERSDESNAQYHSDLSAVSHSMLECFRAWTPTFYSRFVAKTQPAPPPSDSMVIGSAFHCLLLEPQNFHLQFIVSPKFDRRTKQGKADADDFETASNGKTVLDCETMETVLAMTDSVRKNADVVEFLNAPQRREVSFRAVDLYTGLLLKARPDILADETDENYMRIVDIKTSRDPCNWLVDAGKFGYHRQLDHYQRVIKDALDLPYFPEFFHVVVGSSEPYQVVIYQLGQRSQRLGREQNSESLERLVECHATGDWRDPRQIGVVTGDIPAWNFPKEKY